MTFLYPYFLLLLLVPIVWKLNALKQNKNNAWAKECDPELLPFLTVSATGKESIFYRRLMIGLWCLASICLASPAVLKEQASGTIISSGIVVVADMSPAMDTNAAAQMSRKLYDLLDMQKQATIGLVLTDTKAYTALPMTQDKSVFKNIIPTLKERIMPAQGQNIQAGIKRANELLTQSGFKNGQILLITAGVPDTTSITQAIKQSDYPVRVLGVGEKEAHPAKLANGQFWNNGQPILVALNDLPSALGNDYKHATLDESDLKVLLKTDAIDKVEATNQTLEEYQNLGVYGLILLVPLTALLFRRGVLWIWILLCFAVPAHASIWWRNDQQNYQTQMQGIADFNIGQYAKAQEAFSTAAPFDIEALYNLATAQAYDGKVQEAIASYEKVLAQNPMHEDAAYNLEILKKQLPPPPPPPEAQPQSNEQVESDEQQNADNSQSGNEEQQSAEATAQNEQQQAEGSSEQKSDETSENIEPKENAQNEQLEEQPAILTPDENAPEEQGNEQQSTISAQEQKQKEWLDKINPDAGRVLRYRLLKQYQEQP